MILLTTLRSRIGLASLDPEYRELRGTIVTMGAVLASYGSGLLVEHFAHLHLDIVIEAVMLTRIAARVQRQADLADWIIGFAVLPVVTGSVAVISGQMTRQPLLGDSLFVLGMFTAIWVRRFGPHATKMGSLTAAPLVTTLILHAQGATSSGSAGPWWPMLIALIAYAWVAAFQVLAVASEFGVRSRPVRSPGPTSDTGARSRALPASTRMALQMAASLAAALVIGHLVWPTYWSWVVITAYVVCSGARGRGDVVYKGILRAGGAMIGTLLGIGISGLFSPHTVASVVLMFLVLALATWLREFNYAFWAAGITTTLSLLYSWFGEPARSLLPIRLEEIAVGGVIGIAASWFIMPVRSRDVVRRGSAQVLRELAGALNDDWQDPGTLHRHQTTLTYFADRLEQVGRALRVNRSLFARLLPHRKYQADVIDAIRCCVGPTLVVLRFARENSSSRECVAPLADAVAANATAARDAVIRRSDAPALKPSPSVSDTCQNRPVVTALKDIDNALSDIFEFFSEVRTEQCQRRFEGDEWEGRRRG